VASLVAEEQNQTEKSKSPFFFASLDFIYWNAHEPGLAYAIKNKGSHTIADDADFKNLDFKYSPGFKAGLGYHLPLDHWDLSLQLTRLHNKAPTHVKAKEDEVLFPIWINAASTGPGTVDEARARWRLHFGTLDLLLSRHFFPIKSLCFIPQAGLRGAIIRQKYQIHYQGGSLFPGIEDRTSMKNKFFGGGPLIGINSIWNFYSHLSVFAYGAISLLYGNFYVHETEKANFEEKDQRLKIFNQFKSTNLSTDLSLGLQWEKLHSEDRFRYHIHLAWEHHVFTQQNQFSRFVDRAQGAYVSNQGDLTLQGWTLGLRFDY